MKIAIVGDGAWGTALALALTANGHAVTVWGPFPSYIATIRATRTNPRFLPGVDLGERIEWTSEHARATEGASVVFLATPSRYFADVLSAFTGLISGTSDVVSVTKGLDGESLETMSRVASRLLGGREVCALSGPSHAEEVARFMPTAVTVAASDPAAALRFQKLLNSSCFRVYTSEDVLGVELGGALKNVVALAVGVADGLGYGDNARAALITRGLAEIARVGIALGAQPRTFAGLSGMGDLIVTCTSQLSRNRGAGERIGRGESAADILANSEQAVEGMWNCKAAQALARRHGIECPITDEVVEVVHNGKSPRDAVHSLMSRDPKPE